MALPFCGLPQPRAPVLDRRSGKGRVLFAGVYSGECLLYEMGKIYVMR